VSSLDIFSTLLRLRQAPYMKRIAEYRNKEMRRVLRFLSFSFSAAYTLPCSFLRTRLVVRALNNAIAFSLPVLSSVLSIVTYVATGHELDAGILFSSLALFTLLRIPLQFLRTSGTSLLPHILLTKATINSCLPQCHRGRSKCNRTHQEGFPRRPPE